MNVKKCRLFSLYVTVTNTCGPGWPFALDALLFDVDV